MQILVRKLRQIKYQCEKHKKSGCTNCIFYDNQSKMFPCNAQMAIDTMHLNSSPSNWDIQEVAYLLYGEE